MAPKAKSQVSVPIPPGYAWQSDLMATERTAAVRTGSPPPVYLNSTLVFDMPEPPEWDELSSENKAKKRRAYLCQRWGDEHFTFLEDEPQLRKYHGRIKVRESDYYARFEVEDAEHFDTQYHRSMKLLEHGLQMSNEDFPSLEEKLGIFDPELLHALTHETWRVESLASRRQSQEIPEGPKTVTRGDKSTLSKPRGTRGYVKKVNPQPSRHSNLPSLQAASMIHRSTCLYFPAPFEPQMRSSSESSSFLRQSSTQSQHLQQQPRILTPSSSLNLPHKRTLADTNKPSATQQASNDSNMDSRHRAAEDQRPLKRAKFQHDRASAPIHLPQQPHRPSALAPVSLSHHPSHPSTTKPTRRRLCKSYGQGLKENLYTKKAEEAERLEQLQKLFDTVRAFAREATQNTGESADFRLRKALYYLFTFLNLGNGDLLTKPEFRRLNTNQWYWGIYNEYMKQESMKDPLINAAIEEIRMMNGLEDHGRVRNDEIIQYAHRKFYYKWHVALCNASISTRHLT